MPLSHFLAATAPPPGTVRANRVHTILLVSLTLLLALWVHRRALFAFFGADDLIHLEQASGLLPPQKTIWRFLSQNLYFKAMTRVFGLDPLPYHAATLVLHLVNCIFVFAMSRFVGLSRPAAFLASAIFGTFPLFYTVLLYAVNINDVMALCFAFAALHMCHRVSKPRHAWSVLFMLLALFSKESVLFIPLCGLVPVTDPGTPGRLRRSWPLLVCIGVFAAVFVILRLQGLAPGGRAYAMGFGGNLFHNLMTYSSWVLDLAQPVPDRSGVFSSTAWRAGLWPLAGLAVASITKWRGRRLFLFAGSWWLLGLLPVLPLLRHTYGQYMYVPMVGMAIALGGAGDWAAGVLRRGAWGRWPAREEGKGGSGEARADSRVWLLAVGVAVAYALQANSLIEARVRGRLAGLDLSSDPLTRRVEIAGRALESFSFHLPMERCSVVVLTPAGASRTFGARSQEAYAGRRAEAHAYDLMEAVLDSGRAVQLFHPNVAAVRFATHWSPGYEGFELFSQVGEGRVAGFGRGLPAHARLATHLLQQGHNHAARDYLGEVLDHQPGAWQLRFLYGVSLARAGNRSSAIEQLRTIVQQAPDDSLARHARSILEAIARGDTAR